MASAYGLATRSTATAHYSLFWLGFLIALAPAAAQLLRSSASTNDTRAALLAITLVTYVPKILRTPSGPVYFDEMIHYRGVTDLLTTGSAFGANPLLPVSHYFPGLELVTATLHWASGAGVWLSAMIVIGLAHALVLFAVYDFAAQVTGRGRAAACAALLYLLAPSVLYWDVQFAYESLGLAFCFLALSRWLQLAAGTTRRRPAVQYLELSLLCGACLLTHHVSVCVLAFALLWATAWRRLFPPWAQRRPGGPEAFAGGFAVATALYLLFIAKGFTGYVGPYFATSLADVTAILHEFLGSRATAVNSAAGGTAPARALFAHSTIPGYEHVLAIIAPVALLVVCVIGAVSLLKDQRSRRYAGLPLLFALAYFGSLPFVLTTTGSELAHRSWAFTFLGVAVLGAAGLERVLHPTAGTAGRSHYLRLITVALCLCVTVIGDTAAGDDAGLRFPAPYEFESDGAYYTPALGQLATWFNAHAGANRNVITDRDTGEFLGAYAKADPLSGQSDGYLLVYLSAAGIQQLLPTLRAYHPGWLILDKALPQNLQPAGTYIFNPYEPDINLSPATLTRFEGYRWANLVYNNSRYLVYRLFPTEM